MNYWSDFTRSWINKNWRPQSIVSFEVLLASKIISHIVDIN
jgi:hypothetical protein